MSRFARLPAAALTELYRTGEASPVEVARDTFARIEAARALNAFMPLAPEPALARIGLAPDGTPGAVA